MPDVLRWAKLASQENHEDMSNILFAILSWVGMSAPVSIKDSLPLVVDLMLESEQMEQLSCKTNDFFLFFFSSDTVLCFNKKMYINSRLSLSQTLLSRITAYLEVKIWSLF